MATPMTLTTATAEAGASKDREHQTPAPKGTDVFQAPEELPFVDPKLLQEHSEARRARNGVKKNDSKPNTIAPLKRKSESQTPPKNKSKKSRPVSEFRKLERTRVRSSLVPKTNSSGKVTYTKSRWIRCGQCKKWRRVCCSLPFESMTAWRCLDNADRNFGSCDLSEEELKPGEMALEGEKHEESYLKEEEDFFKHLNKFRENNSYPKCKKPLLGGKDLDLYRLYREVIHSGGYEAVIKKPGTWSKIFRSLDNAENRKVTDASYRLKWYYTETLYAFEQHFYHGIQPKNIKVPTKPKRPSRAARRSVGKIMDSFAATFWHQAQMYAKSRWMPPVGKQSQQFLPGYYMMMQNSGLHQQKFAGRNVAT